MKIILSLIALFCVSLKAASPVLLEPQKALENKDQEKEIYIMPDDKGWTLVEQCTRSVYYPETFWRVTEEQIAALEKLLIREIKRLKEQNADFVPEPLTNYKRQYIGFELEGQSFFYANFFPKTYRPKVDPIRSGVVVCRGDKRFWGALFNIETFRFEAIERNDKMVKPKGAYDPRLYDEPQKENKEDQ